MHCINKNNYIKWNRTKHISPKLFYTYKLQKIGEIDVLKICSSDNLIGVFTKSLSTLTFERLIHKLEFIDSRILT